MQNPYEGLTSLKNGGVIKHNSCRTYLLVSLLSTWLVPVKGFVISHLFAVVWRNGTVGTSIQTVTRHLMADVVPARSVSIYEGLHLCGQEGSKEEIVFCVSGYYTGCV